MRVSLASIFSHNWLIKKIVYDAIKKAAPKYACGVLLDIGCGEKPYESEFRPHVRDYIGLDHEKTIHDKSKIDIFTSAYDTTMEDNSVDTIICLSVLEHLERPLEAVSEMRRVLKSGGYAILTSPFFWHLHEEPRDFYRYTKYGIKYLLEENGFQIIELNPLTGFWVTFGQELVYYLWKFRKGGKLNPLWWIVPTLGTLIQGVCYLLNKIDHSEGFTCAYLAIARKE
ncbi:MAG: methyltransferase domain-containing protein [Candidatus Omnitrophota bacterium]